MDLFNLNSYKVPHILYRVDYEESATTYNPCHGLEAQDILTTYGSDYSSVFEFGDAVERHLSWDRSFRSMFISLFADKTHAENWMLYRKNILKSKDCSILEIDMTVLRNSYIFRAKNIVRTLSLSVPEKALPSVAKEYLIAHHIPPVAIVRRQTIREIEMGK